MHTGEPSKTRSAGTDVRSAKLSIIMPVYNEAATIRQVFDVVRRVQVPIPREIILVDDGSRDGSGAIIDELAGAHGAEGVRALHHARNRGKGAGIRTALDAATGTIALIQDADLEYNPQ